MNEPLNEPLDEPLDVWLRRLRSDDISQVVEIEREAFSSLWVSTAFKRELNNRFASYLVACYTPAEDDAEFPQSPPPSWRRVFSSFPLNKFPGMVAKREPEDTSGAYVAGYVSVWYQGEEAHITEIAVREKLRGRGIGELLLIGSLRAAVEYGSKVMTLEARVSNFVAQRLYEKYGFKSVGLRKGYYSDNREDAVIMTTNPIDGEDYQRMFQGLQDLYRSRWGENHHWIMTGDRDRGS